MYRASRCRSRVPGINKFYPMLNLSVIEKIPLDRSSTKVSRMPNGIDARTERREQHHKQGHERARRCISWHRRDGKLRHYSPSMPSVGNKPIKPSSEKSSKRAKGSSD